MQKLFVALMVLILCAPILAQVSIPIVNSSFEEPAMADAAENFWNQGPQTTPGWTIAGALNWQAGIADPSLGSDWPEPKEAQHGENILWMTSGTATQTLNAAAVEGTFTLSVWVSHRKKVYEAGPPEEPVLDWGPNPYDLELLVDEVPATAATVTKPTTHGDIWQLAQKTYTFAANDPALGKVLAIRLTTGGQQQIYDNVSLTLDGNLLVNRNPSFTFPTASPSCTLFDRGTPTGWTGFGRNKSLHHPEAPDNCPRNGDYFWASLDAGTAGTRTGYHLTPVTIPATDGSQTYKFSGVYYLGDTGAGAPTKAYFEIYANYTPGATNPLASKEVSITDNQTVAWTPFSVTTNPPPGTNNLTAVCRMVTTDGSLAGLHVDGLSLSLELACPDQPTVTAIDPVAAVRGTSFTMNLTGQNFSSTGGAPTVSITNGTQTFEATGVTVVGPSLVTADFTLPPDAAHDLFQGTYSQPTCTSVPLPSEILVYLPALTNGSFEWPASADCATPADVVPIDWMASESLGWGYAGRLKLNGFIPDAPVLSYLPTCPAPDGSQYATMASNTEEAGAHAYATQTVAATTGAQYALSGFFAGSGDNTVLLQLREGGPGGPVLPAATATIIDGPGSYNWRFGYVKATASTPIMTAEWAVTRRGGYGESQNAAHADGLTLESCTSAVAVSSILPDKAVNNANVTVTIITSGFSSSPTVFLSKPGSQVFATTTSIDAGGLITAVLPITDVAPGRYDVIVKEGGCIADLFAGFNVIGKEFVNGSFELPPAPQTTCQDHAPKPILGLPAGWSFEGELVRDHAVQKPDCPLPDGIHYGSMTNGGSEMRRAWQTLRVQPGQNYRFSGRFAGNNAIVTIRLLQGDEFTGTEVASKTVPLAGPTWVADEVTGRVNSGNVMTVMWEMVPDGTGLHGAHADQLTFAPVGLPCNDPSMDADNDDDVDQGDFALLQRCLTVGTSGLLPDGPGFEYCHCFDRDGGIGDGDIDSADVARFVNCAGGPNVPADTGCDGEGN